MGNILSPVLRPLGLDPSQGYDTAAAGAREAQNQANQLSDLQWQRQMAGLQQAQGYTNQLQALYNSLYSPGGGAPAAGGLSAAAMNAPSPGAGMLLPNYQQQAQDKVTGALSSIAPWAKSLMPKSAGAGK